MNKTILHYDTCDDRREIHRLLMQLPAFSRLQWLKWCCKQCALNGSRVHPAVPPYHRGGAMECYFDFWSLINEYHGLDADKALKQLEQMAKKVK